MFLSRQHAFVAVLMLVLLAGAAGLIAEARALGNRHQEADAPLGPLHRLRWFAVSACVAAVAVGTVRWRGLRSRGATAFLGFPLRGCLYAGLLAFTAASVAHAAGNVEEDTAVLRSVFLGVLFLGLSIWSILIVAFPHELFGKQRGPLRFVDRLLMNVVLLLVAAETVVSLYARAFPTELLWNETSVESRVAAYRRDPGTRFLGFPINSGGYHDREFFRAGEKDLVVALLADSFGLGIVPYEENFATIAENRLAVEFSASGRRVAVHNFGIASIGISEYAWLLANEVPTVNPTLVILCVFVGNDISGLYQTRRRYYCLQNLQVYHLSRRLLALHARGTPGQRMAPESGDDPPRPERGPALPFLRVETQRLEVCNIRSPSIRKRYRAFFEALDYFRRRLRDRLLVVIIPDEFQVNDDLYETLLRRVNDRDAYRREHPQEQIVRYCQAHGIRVLDLLEPLREGQRLAPVYQPRDTHWNAHGNRIAGEVIAGHVRELLRELDIR